MRLMLSFVLTSLILALGCSGNPPPPLPSAVASATVDLSVATTVGNTTYVPINVRGDASTHVTEILKVIESFEKEHPKLTVTDFDVQAQQSAHTTNAFTDGVWIRHYPNEDAPARVCPPT